MTTERYQKESYLASEGKNLPQTLEATIILICQGKCASWCALLSGFS